MSILEELLKDTMDAIKVQCDLPHSNEWTNQVTKFDMRRYVEHM